MRREIIIVLAVIGFVIMPMNSASHAISLDFVPATQTLQLGSTVAVGIRISGLGNLTSPSLGTFDINVSFDSARLSFVSAVFGDSILGDQLDLLGLGGNPTSSGLVGPSTLNLFELSLDSQTNLDSLQAGAFTLATVRFATVAQGTSPLTIAINVLGDSAGGPLAANSGSGSITIAGAIPEPSVFFLIGFGLFGMYSVIQRRRQCNSRMGLP